MNRHELLMMPAQESDLLKNNQDFRIVTSSMFLVPLEEQKVPKVPKI